jgi:hypothetical protein
MDTQNLVSILQSILLILVVGLFLCAVFFFLGLSFLRSFRENVLRKKGLNLVFFEVKLPKSNEIEIRAAEQMYSGLLGIGEKLKGIKKFVGARKFVSLEIVAFKGSIKFYVVCPKSIASIVDRQINGTYPLAEINEVKEYNLFPDAAAASYTALKLDRDTRIQFQTYDELAVDTVGALTDVFSKLSDNEGALFQMIISPVGSEWRSKSKSMVKKLRETPKEGEAPVKSKFDDDTISLIDKKADKPGFYTDLRIVCVANTKFESDSNLANILSVFDQFLKEGGNKFAKIKEDKLQKIAQDVIYRIPRQVMVLNTAELATLYHFPNRNIKSPHIKWLSAKKAPAPDFVPSSYDNDYMYIGRNSFRGQYKEIFLKPEDRLRHFYIIGMTGTGKSGFMTGMFIRDMKLGHGCAYIDPHGTDADNILQYVPPERLEDVVIFDPSDIDRPVGLNMLEFDTQAQRSLATDEMLKIFDTLYDLKTTGGPMFEQYFRFAIMLLTEDTESGSTLMEVPKIFADEGYRNYKLSKCTNDEITDFWRKQAEQASGDVSLKNVTPYIVSKLAPFLTNPYVRPIIAQQVSTIKFREIMDQKKILIVKLSKGRIGDLNASLLGMILVGKLKNAALEREGNVEAKDRVPFYLYIDEMQNFLTDGITVILSEARKYKLSLTLAHQNLGQLTRGNGDTKIKDSIFGNVANKAIFRIGEDDSTFFKKVIGDDFDESDLQQIENFNFYYKMLVDGKPTSTFTTRSFWGDSQYDMVGKPNTELSKISKEISRLKYGKDKNIIENEIKLRGTFIKEKTADEKKSSSMSSLFGGF